MGVKAESEREFQKTVIQMARLLGYRAAHFRRVRVQRRGGTTYYETPAAADGVGWPDLVLVRAAGKDRPGRVLFIELKAQRGLVRPTQRAWLALLKEAGAEAYCWRPKDWQTIEEVLKR
jgi:hypothetical protein